MPANRVSAITVRSRKRRTDPDSAAVTRSGVSRRGGGHSPHWASSMMGVLRTRGW